jgi:hypothetical protein
MMVCTDMEFGVGRGDVFEGVVNELMTRIDSEYILDQTNADSDTSYHGHKMFACHVFLASERQSTASSDTRHPVTMYIAEHLARVESP